MIAICMGKFGLSILEAKRCTPVDYVLYSKAHEVRNEEQTRMIALQAWMNQSVQATKKSGKDYKSVYRNFDDFYDSEKYFYKIFDIKKPQKPRQLSLMDKNRLLNRQKGG